MISLPAVCVHDTIFVDVTHKYEMPGWSIAVMVVQVHSAAKASDWDLPEHAEHKRIMIM